MTTALGFDLSTQQLKCIAIDVQKLDLVAEASVTFDDDFPEYGTRKGVHVNGEEITAPVEMWIKALDLVLQRMKESPFDFSTVAVISGAGQQHGSVYWSSEADKLLANMHTDAPLHQQLQHSFSYPHSPNWQDHSTQVECDELEVLVGGPQQLAEVTGSRAHHRFTGPQILRFRKHHADKYSQTSRISLVSSFLASLFLGKIAPFDISDVCGMNLWNLKERDWHREIIDYVAGKGAAGNALLKKLGGVEHDGAKELGNISGYFVQQYGFPKDAAIIPFTGDNPSTILSLPLRPLDCIVSLGTSTTLLMSTPVYKASKSYHLFDHPTTPGNYMFMLCYKNGSLARESVRDSLSASNNNEENSWDTFNEAVNTVPILGRTQPSEPAKLGIYFPLAEIVPRVNAGTWRFESDGDPQASSWSSEFDARAIVESQALSMRLRSEPMLQPCKENGNRRQPRRIYLVGGASQNPAIARVLGEVLGGAEGIYRLDAGQACALGSAHKAAWAIGRKPGQTFEDFVGERWNERTKTERVSDGYQEKVWEQYESILPQFASVERIITKQ